MAAELKYKEFESPNELCEFVNEKKVKVVSISEDEEYFTLWYRNKKDI